MIVLGVSTSSPRGTVAVVREDEILARVAYDGATSHAERLFAAIDEALAKAGVTRAEVDALACDVGPGSFTGVRVGVASLKGIALAMSIPAVGIGSLEAMASAATPHAAGRNVLAIVDARKGEVFAAIYDPTLSPVWGPQHLPRSEVARLVELSSSRDAIVVGAIAVELEGLPPPARSDVADLPDATAMALLAARRLGSLDPSDAMTRHDAACLEAVYVRAPDAKPMHEQR